MYDPGKRTPGRETPGLSTPQFDSPGNTAPGSAFPSDQSDATVAIDATGTTTLGTVEGDRDQALVVTVNADAADFDFNIEVGGSDLFSAEQSPGGTTEESFTPDTAKAVVESAVDEDVVIDVSSASSTGSATADVTASFVSENQT